MKTYYYLLIALAALAGGYVLYKKKEEKESPEENKPETIKKNNFLQRIRSLEELKALPQYAQISYEEAKLLNPSHVYFDNPITPELTYSISIRQDYPDQDIYDHFFIISEQTAKQLENDGCSLMSFDHSFNGGRYAEIEYEEALEIAANNDFELYRDGGDGPEYEYTMHSNVKSGLISRRTFAALMPKATYVSIN